MVATADVVEADTSPAVAPFAGTVVPTLSALADTLVSTAG